jgi:hypothetical protein
MKTATVTNKNTVSTSHSSGEGYVAWGRHLNRIAQNEREKPNRIMQMAAPATDVKRMGLRPM